MRILGVLMACLLLAGCSPEAVEDPTPLDGCQPISEHTQARIQQRWGEPAAHGVQVQVGEGISIGERWWVVAYEAPSMNEYVLTNYPGLSPSQRGIWFRLSHTGWDGVEWDRDRLDQGEAALAKASECLRSAAGQTYG
ncbi:MAG TPA: hypothetical protein GXZ30_02610 [Propionibacterium sp.]|jgi:hypothetical protein|nr:hypothetical protein [Propionibacterium sp.]